MERAKIKKAAEEAKYQKKKAAFEAAQAKAAKDKVCACVCWLFCHHNVQVASQLTHA